MLFVKVTGGPYSLQQIIQPKLFTVLHSDDVKDLDFTNHKGDKVKLLTWGSEGITGSYSPNIAAQTKKAKYWDIKNDAQKVKELFHNKLNYVTTTLMRFHQLEAMMLQILNPFIETMVSLFY